LELVPTLHVAVEDAPEADFPREPAVPIHDDRHVMGDRGLSDLVEEPTFVRLVCGVTNDLRNVRRHRRILTSGPDLFIHSRPRSPGGAPGPVRRSGRRTIGTADPPANLSVSSSIWCTQFFHPTAWYSGLI